MLYTEIIAICSQIHTKHINTLCGQSAELLNVKLVVHIVALLTVSEQKTCVGMNSKATDVHLPTSAVNTERDASNLTQNFLGLEVLHQTDRIEMWFLGTHFERYNTTDRRIKACTLVKLYSAIIIKNVV